MEALVLLVWGMILVGYVSTVSSVAIKSYERID